MISDYEVQMQGYSQVEYCSCEWDGFIIQGYNPVYGYPQISSILCHPELLENYCFWDFFKTHSSCEASYDKIPSLTSEDSKKWKKKLLLERMDFSNNLKRLMFDLDKVYSLSSEATLGTQKYNRRNSLSYRRSNYIGVSRNGPNWQALIAINKRKTYIGTYDTEAEAAKAFDFYSLLLHSLKARTNYSYTKHEILEMIEKYKDPLNNNRF